MIQIFTGSFVLLEMCMTDMFFFFKQKTAYEMRESDWSSDVCSSDLFFLFPFERVPGEDDGTSTYVAGSSVYVAPAASLDEAKALLESYGLMESHGLPIPDESPQ